VRAIHARRATTTSRFRLRSPTCASSDGHLTEWLVNGGAAGGTVQFEVWQPRGTDKYKLLYLRPEEKTQGEAGRQSDFVSLSARQGQGHHLTSYRYAGRLLASDRRVDRCGGQQTRDRTHRWHQLLVRYTALLYNERCLQLCLGPASKPLLPGSIS
jgi:hypothetical protein